MRNSKRTIKTKPWILLFSVTITGLLLSYQISAAACSNPNPPTHRLVVSHNGGADCTSINDALTAITSPSSTNTWTVEVLPGTYQENITMKSFVTLQGAGREVTIIQATNSSSNAITIGSGLSNIGISGFTVKSSNIGVSLTSASEVTLAENTITGNTIGISSASSSITVDRNTINSNINKGLSIENSGSATITGNAFTSNANAFPTGDLGGMYVSCSPSPCFLTVTGNVFIGNATGIFGVINGMIGLNHFLGNTSAGITLVSSPSLTITGNTILSNGGGGGRSTGIANFGSSPKILNNQITGNVVNDITVDSTSIPNISFNVYDNLSGSTGVGNFNVSSTGVILPAP